MKKLLIFGEMCDTIEEAFFYQRLYYLIIRPENGAGLF